MPKLSITLAEEIRAHRPDKVPNIPANTWGQFISHLKQKFTPQLVQTMIEDLGTRDKQTIMDALVDLNNTDEAKAIRAGRKT